MIDLDIPVKPQYKNKRFKLKSNVIALFNDYFEAAKFDRKDLSQDELLEAILVNHINKDRKFKAWKQGGQNK